MKIYLASPYTHEQKNIVHDRVRKINAHAAKLMSMGHIVFSPISHSHPIAMENELPTTFEFWQAQNHEFIRWCDAIVVLKLHGWKTSKGVTDEIEYAKSLGKKIIRMMPR